MLSLEKNPLYFPYEHLGNKNLLHLLANCVLWIEWVEVEGLTKCGIYRGFTLEVSFSSHKSHFGKVFLL